MEREYRVNTQILKMVLNSLNISHDPYAPINSLLYSIEIPTEELQNREYQKLLKKHYQFYLNEDGDLVCKAPGGKKFIRILGLK